MLITQEEGTRVKISSVTEPVLAVGGSPPAEGFGDKRHPQHPERRSGTTPSLTEAARKEVESFQRRAKHSLQVERRPLALSDAGKRLAFRHGLCLICGGRGHQARITRKSDAKVKLRIRVQSLRVYEE